MKKITEKEIKKILIKHQIKLNSGVEAVFYESFSDIAREILKIGKDRPTREPIRIREDRRKPEPPLPRTVKGCSKKRPNSKNSVSLYFHRLLVGYQRFLN